jgi:NCAIR mutase (PurE)-related protein
MEKHSDTIAALGYANIDLERKRRTGYSEVIFCLGKTPDQVAGIMRRMVETERLVIGTKAEAEQYEATRAALLGAELDAKGLALNYYADAKMIILAGTERDKRGRGRIAVVSGGTADIPIAEEAALTAEAYGFDVLRVYDVGVAGLHRLLARTEEIRSADVVVAVAGMEGALASVVAGLVRAPVIAVPTSIGYGASFEGITALLAMLNSCSLGVAVMNIDNGFGAGHLAAMIADKGEATEGGRP